MHKQKGGFTERVDASSEPKKPYLLSVILWMLPLLAAICGAVWTVAVYFEAQEAARRSNAETALVQNRTRLLEIQRPYLDKQLAFAIEMAAVLGVLSTGKVSDPKWEAAEARLVELRYGALPLFDTCRSIGSQIDTFRNRLALFKAKPDTKNMRKLLIRADNAASNMRDILRFGWSNGVENPERTAKDDECGGGDNGLDDEDVEDAKGQNIELPVPQLELKADTTPKQEVNK